MALHYLPLCDLLIFCSHPLSVYSACNRMTCKKYHLICSCHQCVVLTSVLFPKDDLWTSLGHVSSKPVAAVMDTWTKQMGFPVLSVTAQQVEKTVLGNYIQTGLMSFQPIEPENARHQFLEESIRIRIVLNSKTVLFSGLNIRGAEYIITYLL